MKRKSDERNVPMQARAVKRPAPPDHEPAKRRRTGCAFTCEELEAVALHLFEREQAVAARERAVLARMQEIEARLHVPAWVC